MDDSIEELIGKAHEYLQLLDSFRREQYSVRKKVLLKFLNNKSIFDSGIQEDILIMDHDTQEVPFLIAERLLSGVCYSSKSIQGMLDRTQEFEKHSPTSFVNYGIFLSVMISHILEGKDEVILDTKNNAIVHVPEFYMSFGMKSSFPWKKDASDIYNRQNLLISHLGSRLHSGKLVVHGNVGNFFGYQNCGGSLQLDGECGWRACYDMSGGDVTINGIAGHNLGCYASGGRIVVNGGLRSSEAHNIELNGAVVSSK